MKKNSWVLIFVLFHAVVAAQQPAVSAYLTLAPGYRWHENQTSVYLHGKAEAYSKQGFGVSGEGYWGLGGMNTLSPWRQDHALHFGVNKHWMKNGSDFYLGFQPGMLLIQSREQGAKWQAEPSISGLVGYQLFFHDYFHFFVQCRTVLARSQESVQLNLGGCIFSVGLGFNLPYHS